MARLCRDYINPTLYLNEEGKVTYDPEKAKEALREKYPCYHVVELRRGECPVCGWIPYYTVDGKELLPRYQHLYYPDSDTIAERELSLILKATDERVKRRLMAEKAMNPQRAEELMGVTHPVTGEKPIDPACTLPKAIGKKCSECDLAEVCKEQLTWVGKETAYTAKSRVGKKWSWRKT